MQIKGKSTVHYQDKVIKFLDEAPDRYSNRWSEFEDGILKKYMKTKSARTIGKALGKTEMAVQARIRKLGLRSG